MIKGLKSISDNENAVSSSVNDLHEGLTNHFLNTYPDLSNEEANDIADKIFETVVQRISNGETLAFIRYNEEDDLVISPYVFEYLGNVPRKK